VHGYRHQSGKIEIIVRLLENRVIYIRIKDKGCGIADVQKAMEPLFTTAPEEERSGLGFSVMESFTDKLTVKSTLGKGTVVTMRKKLTAHE
jgi:stage II sporulation protein AB (anti-sigma F factor)